MKPETFAQAVKAHGKLLMRFNSLDGKDITFWGMEESTGTTIHVVGKLLDNPLLEHAMPLKELDSKKAGIEFRKMTIRYADRQEITIKD